MRGIWLILLAAILWGTTGTAQELGPNAASPLAVGSLRVIVGAAVLLLVAAVRRSGAGWRWLARPATFLAAIGVAAYQLFFFSAVPRTGVAVGTLLALGSAAVFVGFIDAVLTLSLPHRRWITATAPAIAGVVLLATSARDDGAVQGAGVALALAAGLSYAVYVVSATRLARVGSIRRSTAAVFSLAAIALVPIAASQDLSFVAGASGVTMVLWLGVVTLAVAYLLFAAGLRDTDASTAGTLSLAEPVTAAVLGVVVLAERPEPIAWIGVALIIVGLVLASRMSRPQRVATPG